MLSLNVLVFAVLSGLKINGSIFIGQDIGTILGAGIVMLRNTRYYKGYIVGKSYLDKQKRVEINMKDIDYEKFGIVREYIDILEQNLTPKEKTAMHNNLKDVKIKKKKSVLLDGANGEYKPTENEIEYSTDKAIIHELLHMSSSYYNKEDDVSLVGFSQRSGNISIGNGLDEGYTELLSARFYNKDEKPKAYHQNAKVAALLELFFDKTEDMRELYFTHNLPAFIHHMESFAPKEEVYKLINNMDMLRLTSGTLIPVRLAISKNIQNTLNEWFKAKVTDPEKISKFDEIYVNGNMKQINYSQVTTNNDEMGKSRAA